MNIELDTLRRKHKTELVEMAFRVFQPSDMGHEVKSHWIERLIEGYDFSKMLDSLKHDRPLPLDESTTQGAESPFSFGTLTVIDEDMEFHADGRRKLWVSLENHSISTWETTPETSLFAVYHWYDEHGTPYEFDGKRTPLPKPLPPGGALSFEIDVISPSVPGQYRLMATMVLEGQYWLEDKGLNVSQIPLEVLEYDGDGLTRHARDLYDQLKRSAMEAVS